MLLRFPFFPSPWPQFLHSPKAEVSTFCAGRCQMIGNVKHAESHLSPGR
jgi:hypothetical protein